MAGLFSRVRPPSDVFNRTTQLLEQVDKLVEEFHRKASLPVAASDSKNSITGRASALRSQLEKHAETLSHVKGHEHRFQKDRYTNLINNSIKRLDRLITGRESSDHSHSSEEMSADRGEAPLPSNYQHSASSKAAPPIAPNPLPSSSLPRPSQQPPQSMYNEEDEDDDEGRVERGREGGGEEARERGREGEREGRVEERGRVVMVGRPTQLTVATAPAITVSSHTPQGTRIVDGDLFTVLASFSGEEEGDLSVHKGEILRVVCTRADGWWKAMTANGEEGLVPRTYLGHIKEASRAEGREEQRGERRGEGREEQREERQGTVSGHTQLTHMVQPPTAPPPIQPPLQREKRERRSIRESAREGKNARATHTVIQDRRRYTTLGEATRYDNHVSLSCHITPRLSESNLAFHDLFWNREQDMLRKRHVRVSKLIRIVRVEKMNGLGDKGGLVRACLFDRTAKTGRQIVSNIHTIKAKCGRSEWTFNDKVGNDGDSLAVGQFLLRSNYRQSRVNLLIQVSTINIDERGKPVERAIGSVELPLLDDAGKVVLANKSYAECLREGAIFEDDSSHSLVSQRKMVIKVRDPPRDIVHNVDSMPDVVLLTPSHLSLFYFFRRHAGRILVRDRKTSMSTELVNDLVLSVFPLTSDDRDVMDLLCTLWTPSEKALANSSPEEQTNRFRELFSALSMCVISRPLKPFSWTNLPAEAAHRKTELSSISSAISRPHGTLSYLSLARPSPLIPLNLAFDLVSHHAID